ncbi:AlpA family phage regulatory protein [Comamonas testosteroni]|uniref:helix-turn-helix transcriptional regulator n=1 Tax=Comamonas testosteroni TaxID=285 RepID=UPI0009B91663
MHQTVQTQSARPKAAAALLGVSASTIWKWVKERPGFPKPRKLSSRCTVFDVAELVAWRDAQSQAEVK